MKCIKCGTDNTGSDRADNQDKCKECGHPFVFSTPIQISLTQKITDLKFKKILEGICSDENSLLFTEKQFQYGLIRRLENLKKKTYWLWVYLVVAIFLIPGFLLFIAMFFLASSHDLSAIELSFIALGLSIFNAAIAIIVFTTIKITATKPKTTEKKDNLIEFVATFSIIEIGVGIFTICFDMFMFLNPLNIIFYEQQVFVFLWFIIFLFIGIINFYLGIESLLLGKYISDNKWQIPCNYGFSSSQVREWLDRWQEVNGKVEQLLPPPDEKKPTSIPEDIISFTFDRVLVCESDEIAQMLIANNFHIECSCAVIGFRGYPQNIFEDLLEMLQRNPKLKVYALHDASSRGLRLAYELRTDPRWFGRMSVPIFDLGIYPRQVFSMKTPFILASDTSKKRFKELPPEVLKGLSQKEQEWLAAGNTLELEFLSPKKLIQVVRHGIEMSQEMEDIDEIIVFAGIPDDDDTVVAFSSSFG